MAPAGLKRTRRPSNRGKRVDRRRDLVALLVGRAGGGHRVEHVAQRAQEHAALDRGLAQAQGECGEVAGRSLRPAARSKATMPPGGAGRARAAERSRRAPLDARADVRRASPGRRPRGTGASEASATAQPIGLAVNDVAVEEGAARGRRTRKASKSASVASVAASGKHAAGQALREAQEVGRRRPRRAHAKSAPVRPKPVMTSSAISGTPWRSQAARAARTNSGECMRMPAAPCTQRLDDHAGGARAELGERASRARPRAARHAPHVEEQRREGA